MANVNIDIALSELPNYNAAKHLWGIGSEIREQLYSFFTNHKRNVFYTFEYESNKELLSRINSNMLDVYNSYGLYFTKDVRNAIRYFVLIIPKDVFYAAADNPKALQDYVDTFFIENKVSEEHIGFSVIECTKGEQAEFLNRLLCDGENITAYKDFYERYRVENPGFNFNEMTDTSRYTDHPAFRGYTFINFAKLVAENRCFHAVGYMRTLNLQLELLKKVESLGGAHVMFYCNTKDISIPYEDRVLFQGKYQMVLGTMYVKYAAYLVLKYGYKFDVPDKMHKRFIAEMAELISPSHRYVGRYLEYLENPVPIAIKQPSMHPAFLCRRKKSPTDFVCITVQYVEIDSGSYTVLPCAAKSERFCLSAIEVLQITDVYNLHTHNYVEGRAEMRRLQQMLDSVQEALSELNSSVTESLDCSNTLIFRKDGHLYAGYVSDIKVRKRYSTQIFTQGYSFIEDKDFDEQTLKTLIDVRCYPDFDVLFKRDIRNLFGGLDDTSDGFINTITNHNQENVTEACGLYYDSVGLWNHGSSLLRGKQITRLTNCGLPIKGLRRNFLSFFGGPHPFLGKNVDADKPTLELDYTIWEDC